MPQFNEVYANGVLTATNQTLGGLEAIFSDPENSIKRWAGIGIVLLAASIIEEDVNTPNHSARLNFALSVIADGDLSNVVKPFIKDNFLRITLEIAKLPDYQTGHPTDAQIITVMNTILDSQIQ